ncbi:MAG: methyltransferase domain-containing protein [Deltaproteobacteria bacterium]|nr:MAG: methyltransferase domain-containing protein [Deltaproteobacteria bacterium]TMQ27281.1 MAG: methyltransferase domain-containing protein [Deltaproteobacteria bacterium]
MTAPHADYFANHARARQFPWTLYHLPLERDLARFLGQIAGEHPAGEVLIVGCGLLHELDAAPPGLTFHVADIDERAVAAVLARRDPRITGGTVVAAEAPIDRLLGIGRGRRSHGGASARALDRPAFAAIYAKEVIEHVLAWPTWLTGLRRSLVPGGRLWLSTPNYGEPWLPALESTVLELVARRSGFSRRDLHPTRFSRGSLARGLRAAGFEDVAVHVTPTRLALTAWSRAPR